MSCSIPDPGPPAGRQALVRRMTPEDVGAVAELERRCFAQPWSYDLFLAETVNHHSLPLVLCAEGSPGLAGYLIIWMVLDQAEIQNIAICPELRGHGLGRYLLQKGMHLAQARGARLFSLEVRPSNTTARKLYETMGFRQVGLRRNYYPPDGEDALVLALKAS